MKLSTKILVVLLAIATLQLMGASVATAASASVESATPTCSETLGIAVHGQHIIGDYVTGIGPTVGWPPAGKVGEAIAGSGPVVRGGPGPGFHFPNGFAPGASFCLQQSKSPGAHPGLG